MSRSAARTAVNARLDRALVVVSGASADQVLEAAHRLSGLADIVVIDRPLNLPALLGQNGAVNAIAAEAERIRDLGLTVRQIEKRDRDEFIGENLTFEQKRARREAMRYGG